ncbi:MAG: hypothetical protein HZA51_16240 [Planctomycetes bacterium]|nr:hypothetical protein [Planctomycetota bacterium]
MRTLAITCLGLLSLGCTRVDYLSYCGIQEWPTGSAFVQSVDNTDVYEGLPDKPYTVVGLIDVYDDQPFFLNNDVKKKVLKMASDHKADALVWLSDRAVSSGSLRMRENERAAATLDTGRSSQPEMVVTHANQYVSTSYRKSLRSSLLVIKWKS